jgi:tRNA G18 (ribose-2'-O)-methylase SpoU
VDNPGFEHLRHKPASPLVTERELVIVVPALRSRVNLSRIIRVAGSFGVRRVIAQRPFSIDAEVARDASEYVHVESRGALPPVLRKLREEGFFLIGMEQATRSQSLFDFRFPVRAAMLLGHERNGIPAEELAQLDAVVEIPVYGLPLSYNVASAATMAIYEYCRQHQGKPVEGSAQ